MWRGGGTVVNKLPIPSVKIYSGDSQGEAQWGIAIDNVNAYENYGVGNVMLNVSTYSTHADGSISESNSLEYYINNQSTILNGASFSEAENRIYLYVTTADYYEWGKVYVSCEGCKDSATVTVYEEGFPGDYVTDPEVFFTKSGIKRNILLGYSKQLDGLFDWVTDKCDPSPVTPPTKVIGYAEVEGSIIPLAKCYLYESTVVSLYFSENPDDTETDSMSFSIGNYLALFNDLIIEGSDSEEFTSYSVFLKYIGN